MVHAKVIHWEESSKSFRPWDEQGGVEGSGDLVIGASGDSESKGPAAEGVSCTPEVRQ
jgi:hypothetical protein